MAAANGHMAIVEFLISQGVVNKKTKTIPFDIAKAKFDHIIDVIHGILFNFGFGEQDINALNEENNAPLHWACLNGHTQVTTNHSCPCLKMFSLLRFY